MHGASRAATEGDGVSMKFTAAQGQSIEVSFEPVGTTFSLVDGESIYLRTTLENLASIEIVSWPQAVEVWVGVYPGDYVVLDSDGKELDRL